MLPYFTEVFGNAASTGHAFGDAAHAAVDRARAAIAAAPARRARRDRLHLRAPPSRTTSRSRASPSSIRPGTSSPRRPSTRRCSTRAGCSPPHGYRVTVLPVDGDGRIDLDDLERAFAADTLLVSVMHANNEIGTVHDIAAIAALCRARGVLFHTDATQTIGRLPVRRRRARRRPGVVHRRTRCTARRAPAGSTCGAAARCCRSSKAAATNAACAAARSTCRASSAWPRR